MSFRFLALACVSVLGSTSAFAECLPYNRPVTLTGTLVRDQGVDANGRTEVYWALQLPADTCIAADPADTSGLNPAIAHITRIELVLQPEVFTRDRARLGTTVSVRGTLFGAQTAHHHTAALLGEAQLQPRNN